MVTPPGWALGTGNGGALVGRDAELGVVERCIAGVGQMPSRCIEVRGEPGIGKTRLLGELCRRADDRGHLVLEGRAAEYEREMPFGVLVAALDDYLGSLPPRFFEPLGRERLGDLAAVFPLLSELVGADAARLQAERSRAHRAISALLERLGASRELVLALDDMHWADAASLELLSHLLRRPPSGHVLIAFSLRHRPVPPELDSAVERAAREGHVERVVLEPLSEADCARILENHGVDEHLWGELCRESGGNPFFLEQLARMGVDHRPRPTESTDAGSGDVPGPVIAAVQEELRALPADSLAMLQGAAVAGDPFEVGVAAASADLAEAAALDRLDDLVAAGLARPTDLPRHFRFRHPIVRGAVYEATSPGWRLAAHGRAATALAAQGASADARAHHVERSAQPGDLEAVGVLSKAAGEASPRAPATAAGWLRAALEVLPATPEHAEQRLGLLQALAEALAAAGRLADCRDVLRDLLDLVPPELTPLRVRLIVAIAPIDNLLGHHDEAHELLASALEALPADAHAERAELEVERAVHGFFCGDFDTMLAWGRRGLETAKSLDDASLHAKALAVASLAEYNPGNIREAWTLRGEATALLDALDDEALAPRLDAVYYLAHVEQCLGLFREAGRHAERGLALAAATGQPFLVPSFQMIRGLDLISRGALTESQDVLEAAHEAALLSGNVLLVVITAATLSWALLFQGEIAQARRLAEESVRESRSFGAMLEAIETLHLSEVLIEDGQPGRARDALLAAAGGPELEPIERAARPRPYELLVRAELELGRVEAAREWLARSEEALLGHALPERVADVLRSHAAVRLASGDAAGAVKAATEAADVAERADLLFAAARARLLEGRALAALGDDRAVEALERSEAELGTMGAKRYRDAAARELRRLGRRVARGGRPGVSAEGVAGLSERELQIAELVAAGRRNRQIAAELFLSEKTVEANMSKILAKLGVSSRSAVGAVLERSRGDGDGDGRATRAYLLPLPLLELGWDGALSQALALL